jgi:hypothetical protein
MYATAVGICFRKLAAGHHTRQCCGSGMFIPDPDFYPSRILDLGSKNSNLREGWKKIFLSNLFLSHKLHIIINYFIFEMLKISIWVNFERIIELFTQKLSLSSQKYGFGIREKPIPDPGSRGQKGTGSRIRIRNTGTRTWLLPAERVVGICCCT